jgi:hypothetical protein
MLWLATLTEVYRKALSREVRAVGYEIENRRDVAGKDKGFEIVGLSQEILASAISIANDRMISVSIGRPAMRCFSVIPSR